MKKAEDAEALAVEALLFMAGDPELLARFLDLTGIAPSAIRTAAGEPGFLAGTLSFVLAHEPTLLRFADHAGVRPEAVMQARRALPFGDDHYDRSM